jgi:hypothetical protein
MLIPAAVILLVWTTRGFWFLAIGRSLLCDENIAPTDALLLENFDPNYLVFERGKALQRNGTAVRIFVPVRESRIPDKPNAVAKGIAEVMARIAHIETIELIPFHTIEPVSLNAARQILDFLAQKDVRSITVVAPAFRSRRSSLVYSAVLATAGISVHCVPVFGTTNPDNWTKTWHGIQDVSLQFAKLQYYRFWVLW